MFCCRWTFVKSEKMFQRLEMVSLAMMLHRLKRSFRNKPHQSRRMFAAQFRAAALSFPSNLIVSLLPSDLWHFQHSSHLLLSHLPGSSPAALVSCRLQPQLLSFSFSDVMKADKKEKRAAERKGKRDGGFLHHSFRNSLIHILTHLSRLTMCVKSTTWNQNRNVWHCLK